MSDINIYLKNALREKNSKQQKVSARSTGLNQAKTFVDTTTVAPTQSGLKVAGAVATAIYAGVKTAEKVVNFGVNMWEARTGQSVRASNIKATGKAHTSAYLNVVVAQIDHYLIGRHRVNRQNLELEYNRELYNLNYLNRKHRGS